MKLHFLHILYFCTLIAITSVFEKETSSTTTPVYEFSLSNNANSNSNPQQDKEFPKKEKEEDTSEDNKEENDNDNSHLICFLPTQWLKTGKLLIYNTINTSNYKYHINYTTPPFYILFACQKINY